MDTSIFYFITKKTFLLLCLFFVGLNSISASESTSDKNLTFGVNVEYSNFEKLSDFSLNVGFLEIGLLGPSTSCTAYVYHEGILAKTFTMTTCTAAYAAACDYIQQQGGVCPPATGIN